MPIVFDTVEELVTFYNAFKTGGKIATPPSRRAKSTGKRGKTAAAVLRKPAAKPKVAKARAPRKAASGNVRAQVQQLIQQHIDDKQAFTAQDIYETLSRKETGINQGTVLTTVNTLMSKTYPQVATAAQAGAGLRPRKLYTPQ